MLNTSSLLPLYNAGETWSNFLLNQELEDNAYLEEVYKQLSKLDQEQLKKISFSSLESNLFSCGNDAIYVDKTQQILNASNLGRIFLARPRRMGKSTTLSTIQLLSTEVYLQSIYPEHQLDPILSNTYFAEQYAKEPINASKLGAPYNIMVNFTQFKVDSELKIKSQQEQAIASAIDQKSKAIANARDQKKKVEDLKQDHTNQLQKLDHDLSDNLGYLYICSFLEQKLVQDPDFNFSLKYNLIYRDVANDVELNRSQVKLFLFNLYKEATKFDGPSLDVVKSKVTEIESKNISIPEEIESLNSKLETIDAQITSLDNQINTLEQEFKQLNNEPRIIFSSGLQEKLGGLRETIIKGLHTSMVEAIENNLKVLDVLKAEILSNSPEYQKGLDIIDQHTQLAFKRQKQLSSVLQDIQVTSLWDTLSFSSNIRKLLRVFGVNDLSILIDEYDTCLIDCLGNPIAAEYVRQVMEEFYSVLKDYVNSQFIRILFVTGVTAYAKTSLFTGVNNLNDISYNPEYSDIVGFTEHELKSNFAQIICKHAILNECYPQDIIDALAERYDGYYFALPSSNQLVLPIFTPLSVITALINTKINLGNNWTSSGASLSKVVLNSLSQVSSDKLTQAINQSLNGGIELIINKNDADIFSKVSFLEIQQNAVFLMYQAGYLTIDFEKTFHKQNLISVDDNINRVVVLTPPNMEVRRDLISELEILVYKYKEWRFGEKVDLITPDAQKHLSILEQGRLTLILRAFTDYSLKNCEYSFNLMLGQYAQDINKQSLWENFLRNILFTCIRENINASGSNKLLHAETEVPVCAGRIDLIVTNECDKIKFIFEFKRVEEPNPTDLQIQIAISDATEQINSHNYVDHAGYRVIAIAGAFFRNTKHFAQNPYSLGYHISLAEVKIVQN